MLLKSFTFTLLPQTGPLLVGARVGARVGAEVPEPTPEPVGALVGARDGAAVKALEERREFDASEASDAPEADDAGVQYLQLLESAAITLAVEHQHLLLPWPMVPTVVHELCVAPE